MVLVTRAAHLLEAVGVRPEGERSRPGRAEDGRGGRGAPPDLHVDGGAGPRFLVVVGLDLLLASLVRAGVVSLPIVIGQQRPHQHQLGTVIALNGVLIVVLQIPFTASSNTAIRPAAGRVRAADGYGLG